MKSRHNFLLLLFCALLVRPMFSATDTTNGKTLASGASKTKDDAAKVAAKAIGNNLLGGATMAATGIGGMQLAQGLAEKGADEAASKEMEAYLKTISCGISGGSRNLKYGSDGRTPAVSRQFADARFEYLELAKKMKAAKEGLGLPLGIESELLVDTSTLYDNAGTDQNGTLESLDTAAERAASGSGGQRAMIGGVVASAGIVGGVAGDVLINNGEGLKATAGAIGEGLGKLTGSLGGGLGK